MKEYYNNYITNLSNLHIVRFLLDHDYLSKRTKFDMFDSNVGAVSYAIKKIARDYRMNHPDVFLTLTAKGRSLPYIVVSTSEIPRDLSPYIKAYSRTTPEIKKELDSNEIFKNFIKSANDFNLIKASNDFYFRGNSSETWPYFNHSGYYYYSRLITFSFTSSLSMRNIFKAPMSLIKFLNYTINYKDLCNQTSLLNHMDLMLKL